jgi:hypothetical protein
MPEPSETTLARPSPTAPAPCDRDADTYDRYAPGLYRLALLTLDDAGLAEQVVFDVIVDECVRPPASAGHGGDAGRRLAVSAYRRCQELAGGPAWRNRAAAQRPSGAVAGPYGLSRLERGALGLVLFGGLGCVQASRETAVSPADLAILLRAVLHRPTVSMPDLANQAPPGTVTSNSAPSSDQSPPKERDRPS